MLSIDRQKNNADSDGNQLDKRVPRTTQWFNDRLTIIRRSCNPNYTCLQVKIDTPLTIEEEVEDEDECKRS